MLLLVSHLFLVPDEACFRQYKCDCEASGTVETAGHAGRAAVEVSPSWEKTESVFHTEPEAC